MQFPILGWGREWTAASYGERYCQAGTETGETYFPMDTVLFRFIFSQMQQEVCDIGETIRLTSIKLMGY